MDTRWVMVNRIGPARPSVPPVVLYVDALGLRDASKYYGREPHWSVPVSAEEMEKVVQYFCEKELVDQSDALVKERTAIWFRFVFGRQAEKPKVVGLSHDDARETVQEMRSSLITSPAAVEILHGFAQANGWARR